LDNLDAAKKKKEELVKEIVDSLANMNVVDELMEVYQ
jgi:hypothetical protein